MMHENGKSYTSNLRFLANCRGFPVDKPCPDSWPPSSGKFQIGNVASLPSRGRNRQSYRICLHMVDENTGKVPEAARPDGARRAVRQPSIKDIARLAHVSHPTVSRALQNSPLVNPRTAENIRKIADQAGYHASACLLYTSTTSASSRAVPWPNVILKMTCP